MNITLKNLKIAKFLSEETLAFTATIYVDGKRVGEASNDGHGGPNRYHFDDRKLGQELEAWAKTLPPTVIEGMTLPMDLDGVIDELIEKAENEKYFARLCKKKTLFLLEGDDAAKGWRTLKAPYDARVQAWLDQKYGTKVVRILNKEIQS